MKQIIYMLPFTLILMMISSNLNFAHPPIMGRCYVQNYSPRNFLFDKDGGTKTLKIYFAQKNNPNGPSPIQPPPIQRYGKQLITPSRSTSTKICSCNIYFDPNPNSWIRIRPMSKEGKIDIIVEPNPGFARSGQIGIKFNCYSSSEGLTRGTITINQEAGVGGSISCAKTTVCVGGNPGMIIGSAITNISGYTFQWERKTGSESNWQAISGATGKDYNPGNLSVTTNFRRKLSTGSLFDYSNILKIEVSTATFSAGSIGGNQTVRKGQSPSWLNNTVSAALGCDGSPLSYQWQKSRNQNNWIDIPAAGSISYKPPQMVETTHYRRGVTSGGVTRYTNTVTIRVEDSHIYLGTNPDCGNSTGESTVEPVLSFHAPITQAKTYEASQQIKLLPGTTIKPTNNQAFAFTIKEAAGNSSTASCKYNYILSRTWDMDGKLSSEGIGYYNSLGNMIQSINRNMATNQSWANQIIYDAFNRPAIQSLNAPVGNGLGYVDGLLRNRVGLYYTDKDFRQGRDALSEAGTDKYTIGWYYSEKNNIDPYQDITSYPLTRTVYDDENNAGAPLTSIGIRKINGEWKKGYSFTVPAAQELYYLFGKNYWPGEQTDYGKWVRLQAYKTVTYDVHGNETVVFTDMEGNTLATARSGTAPGIDNPPKMEVVSMIGPQHYVDVHIPKGVTNSDIKFLKGFLYNYVKFRIVDLKTNETKTQSTITGGSVYRISIYYDDKNMADMKADKYNSENDNIAEVPFYSDATFITNENTITTSSSSRPGIRYKINYYDFSLNYYDKAGRLTKSIPPKGVASNYYQLQNTPNHTMASTFAYNAQGQLISTASPDGGSTSFKYRKDGQIRYSQNAKQKKYGKFSYTGYDTKARPIESGEITGNFFRADPDAALPSGTKSNQNFTIYDTDVQSEINTVLGTRSAHYRQTFVAGSVSRTDNENVTSYYSYDVYGRVRWLVQKIKGLGVKTIDYEYDEKSNVSRVYYQKHVPGELFIHRYTYDAAGSLTKVETSADDSNFTEQAEYIYAADGSLKRKELGGNLQGIDYTYTIGGSLKAVNASTASTNHDPERDGANGFSADVFGMQLDYYSGDYARNVAGINSINTGTNQYNGNIKAMRWHTTAFPGAKAYVYDYHPHTGWLKEARYGSMNNTTFTRSEDYRVSDLSYDRNGNILSLYRNGPDNTAIDKLNYTYKSHSNQLTRVADVIAGTTYGDITNQPANNYTYNDIGQITGNKQDSHYFTYDVTGKVIGVYSDANHTSPIAAYAYDDRGFRVKKTDHQNNTTYYVRDAAGSILAVYSNGTLTELPVYGAGRLGVAYKNGGTHTYTYELSDHLGNVRAVVRRKNNTADITNAADYYPFGWRMPDRVSIGGNRYRFGYQGQFSEYDPETGYNQFEARLLDTRIGRWLTTDPAGAGFSPYWSMNNNPVSIVDPTGEKGWFINLFSKHKDPQPLPGDQANIGGDDWHVYYFVGADGEYIADFTHEGSLEGLFHNVARKGSYHDTKNLVFTFSLTNWDPWLGIDRGKYNRISNYEYTFKELEARYISEVMARGSSNWTSTPLATYYRNTEAAGMAGPISQNEYYDLFGQKGGNDLSVLSFMGIAAEITGYGGKLNAFSTSGFNSTGRVMAPIIYKSASFQQHLSKHAPMFRGLGDPSTRMKAAWQHYNFNNPK